MLALKLTIRKFNLINFSAWSFNLIKLLFNATYLKIQVHVTNDREIEKKSQYEHDIIIAEFTLIICIFDFINRVLV